MTSPAAPRHAVVHEGALDAEFTRCASVPRGEARLGADYRDGGDVVVISGGAGRSTLLLVPDALTDVPSAWEEVRSADPGIEADLVCARERSSGALAVYAVEGDGLRRMNTTVVPRQASLFDRVRGVFETDVLRDRSVAVLGLGSGGSFITRELARCGVGRFVLVDHDRLEVGNVCRHEAGLSEVGRLKTNFMRDVVLDRNPAAEVTTLSARIDGGTLGDLRTVLRETEADLVICATDNRPSRLLVNRLCVTEDWPSLYAGVFRRAYGGLVLRVIPGLSPCYQCFVSALPQMAREHEVSSEADAARLAYTDREVPVEPGLSSDIAPVALHVAKLAMLELLGDAPTTLDSLRHDLVAPLYLWLNRREADTDYAQLPPMETGVDGLSVLRWYGLDLPRNPDCATCGSRESILGERAASDDVEFFSAP